MSSFQLLAQLLCTEDFSSPDSHRISNLKITKAPENGRCLMCVCAFRVDPGEDGHVTGSEAGRSRGGPRVTACRAGVWEMSHQRPALPCLPSRPLWQQE